MKSCEDVFREFDEMLKDLVHGNITIDKMGSYMKWDNTKRLVSMLYRIKEFIDNPIKYSDNTIASRQGYASGRRMDRNVGNSKFKSNWRDK